MADLAGDGELYQFSKIRLHIQMLKLNTDSIHDCNNISVKTR
ncbi:MAG: hypothetical protein RMX96_31450 [Nostoc sp. ChiSLP02]|nr:hypothetical protein [Nostoc sp. ChiSLP02]